MGHAVDAILVHTAAFGATGQEEVVAIVYILLHQGLFVGCHRTGYIAKVSHAVGLDKVIVQAQLILQQSLHVGNHAKDADGTGEGGWFGYDGIGVAGDVVATRGGIVAHADDDRLLLLELLQGVPDLF